ncbi:hypothetical protein CsSME_00030858 [Camellia sinensis var. sinensis]
MEFVNYLSLLFLLIPIFLFLTKKTSNKLPPGSMEPIIGHSLSFLHAMQANKGEAWFPERIRKYGPISELSLYGTPTVFLHG